MKIKITLLTITLALFGLSNIANAQWNLILPPPAYGIYYSFSFPINDTGYAVGSGGNIIKTTDAGVSWSVKTSGTTKDLLSVFFTDASVGYAVGFSSGANVIIKTTDGGNTWAPQTCSVTTSLNSIHFTNDSTGYIAGYAGVILKTTNRGTTWNLLSTGFTTNLYSISCPTPDTAYAAGNGIVIKTTDAGANWTRPGVNITYVIQSINFTNSLTGYGVGASGTVGIIKTTDGGNTWSQQTSGTTSNLKAIYFLDDNNGYAVGNAGKFLKTTNGGTNWSVQTLGSYDLYSVLFTDQDHGYAGANVSIYTYSNSVTNVNALTNTKSDLMLYPNPSSGKFTINSISKITSLEVFNMMGEKISHHINTNEIDLSNSPKGIYFVKIYDGENSATKKIVVE